MEISTQYFSLKQDRPPPLCGRLSMVIAAITCIILASVSSFSYAAPGGIPGRPDDGGGGGGAAPDYGDLIILYRDDNGVPIPSPAVQVPDPETGLLVDGGLCWQPIAFNVDDETLGPAECVVASVPAR